MKRFDTAIEISKQLITIASAVLVGISALAGSILTNELDRRIFTCMTILYALLALSILAGIVHLGAIANLIETAEKNEFNAKLAEKSPDSPPATAAGGFVSMFDSRVAPSACGLQWVFFVVAFILLVVTLIIDRAIIAVS